MDTLTQDLRYAVRALSRSPGFLVVALATLALAIGANVAVFSVVNGVLLRPLAFDAPERLVRLLGYDRAEGLQGDLTVSYPNYRDWRANGELFEGMAAYEGWNPSLTGAGEAELIPGASVTANYFAVLGVRPAAGRFFTPEDDIPGASRSVVIDYALWQHRFGGARDLVGRAITLNGVPHTVVGITPEALEDAGLERGSERAPQIWRTPPAYWTEEGRGRTWRFLTVIARVRPGITIDQARTAMDAVVGNTARDYPELGTHTVRLEQLHGHIVAPVRRTLLVLLAAVGAVLLIACVNLSNLLLTRAAGRMHEMALRSALGASGGRILRQLLVEGIVLATAGGALGLGFAVLALELLARAGAGEFPRLDQAHVDGTVMLFTAGICMTIGILFALAPAFHSTRLDLQGALAAGGRGRVGLRADRSLRGTLVGVEVALTVALLFGAALLLRSLDRLFAVDPGLRAKGVLTALVSPPLRTYQRSQLDDLYARLLDRARAIPGVVAAGFVNLLPMSGAYWQTDFSINGGSPASTRNDGPATEVRTATPDLFRALGVSVLRGRGFTHQDVPGSLPVAVITQTTAARYWSGADPLGDRITLKNDSTRTVVGVVADVRQKTLDSLPEPTVYLPHNQAPFWTKSRAYLVVRTQGDPTHVARPLRAAVTEIDPTIPLSEIRSMEHVVARTTSQPRFRTLLLGFFAGAALFLSLIGIYGVVAYAVVQRTREIGIRMALGAEVRDVVLMLARQGLTPVLVGAAVGIAGALAIGQLLAGLLFDVASTDTVSLIAAPGLLILAAAVATYLPARRVAAMPPTSALQHE